jgi:transposase
VSSGETASDPVPVRRSQRRLRSDEVMALAQARREGAEIKELAERFGVHRTTVLAHLERAEVPGRRRQGRQLSPERLEEAGQLYASGLSLIEVGERFDVDRRYLRRALPAAGFVLRPPGRQAGRSAAG